MCQHSLCSLIIIINLDYNYLFDFQDLTYCGLQGIKTGFTGLVNSSLVSLQQHIEVAQQKKISLNRFFLPLLEHVS